MERPHLLRKPWTSEKASAMGASGKYVFLVDPKATKPEIQKAIRKHYNVEVDRVHVLNVPERRTRFRGMMRTEQEFRKAVVTLKSGHKIDAGP